MRGSADQNRMNVRLHMPEGHKRDVLMQVVAALQSLGAGEVADAEVRRAERQVRPRCILPSSACLRYPDVCACVAGVTKRRMLHAAVHAPQPRQPVAGNQSA